MFVDQGLCAIWKGQDGTAVGVLPSSQTRALAYNWANGLQETQPLLCVISRIAGFRVPAHGQIHHRRPLCASLSMNDMPESERAIIPELRFDSPLCPVRRYAGVQGLGICQHRHPISSFCKRIAYGPEEGLQEGLQRRCSTVHRHSLATDEPKEQMMIETTSQILRDGHKYVQCNASESVATL